MIFYVSRLDLSIYRDDVIDLSSFGIVRLTQWDAVLQKLETVVTRQSAFFYFFSAHMNEMSD